MRKSYRFSFIVLFSIFTFTGIGGLHNPPVIITTHEIFTDDIIPISYNLYYPPELDRTTPVVIMGHGVNVNKEMMSNFAVEFASQGYIVANLDWRGHGQSGGELDRNGLSLDLKAVIEDIPRHTPYADMNNLVLLGYSMGGGPTYEYAAHHLTVRAWIGVGTAADTHISTVDSPENVLMVIATHDEAVSPEKAKLSMVPLTGRPMEDIAFNTTYGDIQEGTARRLQVIPGADHLTTPWDSDFILASVSWISETFDQGPVSQVRTFNQRVLFLAVGLIGLIGLVGMISLSIGWTRDSKIIPMEFHLPLPRFIFSYYLITLLCIPTILILTPLFLTPLPFTALIAVLTGGLGINLGIFSWRMCKKEGCSLKKIIKNQVTQSKKIWIFSIGITLIFMVGYYYIIGLHFLGVVPSSPKIPYLFLYCVILFAVFLMYSLFIQKIARPVFYNALPINQSTVKDVVCGLIIFVLIHSWVSLVILVPCIIIGNYFLAMILILMVPIFLWMCFFSIFMERITGSIIPNAVFQAVWLGFLITTLTPFVSTVTVIH
ncbi:MAG: alpha/beta fold hydrolase [Theionarchaea archaeon]|nr:alpha/beta fold hydrolase [Theionarchaea archaeon]